MVSTPQTIACIMLLLPCMTYADSEVIQPLSLQAALTISLQHNLSLAQQQARAEAMDSIPSQVASLPDPIIHFNALNLPINSFNLAQENMTQLQGGVSQNLPFFGKLALKEKSALHQAEAAHYQLGEFRLQLQRDVQQIWWRIFYLQRALEIIALNQNLLRQFINIARTKYEVGEGLQQDVLLAQLERSKLLDRQLSLQGLLKKSHARLNNLLARPANQHVSLPAQIAETLVTLKSESILYKLAKNSRALLHAQHKSIDSAQSRLALAQKSLLPDFKLGVFYGGRSDSLSGQQRADLMSIKLSMNLPLFAVTKQQKSIDQQHSELQQQRYHLQAQWLQVQMDISNAYSDFQQSKQQSILFKQGIIPQARQTVASMLAGYQVNKVDFLNLVRSQITLYNYEIQYWQAFTKAKQAKAQLIAMVGKEAVDE